MFKLHIMNIITGGIPELVEFNDEASFKKAWKDAYDECDWKARYGHTFEESLKRGYLVNHKTEYRTEELFPPGVRIENKDALLLLDALSKCKEMRWAMTAPEKSKWDRSNSSLYEQILSMVIQDFRGKEHSHLWPRVCSNCERGMIEGWVWGDGVGYACSERCLFIDGYDKVQLEVDYEADAIYWTTWEWEVGHQELQEVVG